MAVTHLYLQILWEAFIEAKGTRNQRTKQCLILAPLGEQDLPY